MLGQNLLYSGKSSCILARWLYTGKAVLFGHSGCIRAKQVVLG